MIDMDFFKNYNDRYGHQAGDRCLQLVAGHVQAAAQHASDLAARYGGEEFLPILPDTDSTAAQRIAEKLRRALTSSELPHAGSPLGRVTVSAGLAVGVPGQYPSAHALLRDADDAPYVAKQAGRDRVDYLSPDASRWQSSHSLAVAEPGT